MNGSSLALELNNSEIIVRDENNEPLTGDLIREGVIFHFINGKLHSIDDKPAVESMGHIEYWNNGLIHRIGQPAIITNNFSKTEYWENGIFLK